MGTSPTFSAKRTVNPLVYEVRFSWGADLPHKSNLLVWNLLQKFAAANDCVPQERKASLATEMVVSLAMKERLGLPKDRHP